MRINIVLRAEDPARAAAIARAIGIPLQDPDRANTECWHVRTYATILVTAADGSPGLSFGPEQPRQFDEAVARLGEAVGDGDLTLSADGGVAVAKAAGLEVRLERDGPQLVTRDIHDVGKLFTVMPIFDKHREAILAALREVGASDPRLVGPSLGRLPGSRHWQLVVDAPESADLAGVEALVRRLGEGFAPVQVRRSDGFARDHLAEIDRLAFDI